MANILFKAFSKYYGVNTSLMTAEEIDEMNNKSAAWHKEFIFDVNDENYAKQAPWGFMWALKIKHVYLELNKHWMFQFTVLALYNYFTNKRSKEELEDAKYAGMPSIDDIDEDDDKGIFARMFKK